MGLDQIVGKESIALHLKGKNKTEIIEELLALVQASGKVADREAAREAVFSREARMSTGMQNGIALPHGKTDAVDEVIACLGVSDRGVDFDSLDRAESRIFILTLSPANRTGPHIRFLADVSALLEDEAKRRAILAATTADQVHRILSGD